MTLKTNTATASKTEFGYVPDDSGTDSDTPASTGNADAFTIVQKAIEKVGTCTAGIFSYSSSLASSFENSPQRGDDENMTKIAGLAAATAVMGIAFVVGVQMARRFIAKRNEERLALETATSAKKNLSLARDLVHMLKHPIPAARKAAAKALGDVFPKLNPEDRRSLAFEVQELLDHRYAQNAALEALGKIVPHLESSKDRLCFAEKLSEKMLDLEGYSDGKSRPTIKAIRALVPIVLSLDPYERAPFAKALYDTSIFFLRYRLKATGHADYEELYEASAQIFRESFHALEEVVPSLNTRENRILFTEHLIDLASDEQFPLPDSKQRAMANLMRLQAQPDDVNDSLTGDKNMDRFLAEIGIDENEWKRSDDKGKGLLITQKLFDPECTVHRELSRAIAAYEKWMGEHVPYVDHDGFIRRMVASYVRGLNAVNPTEASKLVADAMEKHRIAERMDEDVHDKAREIIDRVAEAAAKEREAREKKEKEGI